MRTASGRFEVNKKICMSMSDFHPELWNPMWTIKTILVGLASFMNGDESTTGGITGGKDEADPTERRRLARASLAGLREGDKLAGEIFGDVLGALEEERAGGGWPPVRVVSTPPATAEAEAEKPAATPPAVTPPAAEAISPEEAAARAAKNKKKREAAKRKKAAQNAAAPPEPPRRAGWEAGLAEEIVGAAAERDGPYVLAVAGVPGAGKSTQCALLAGEIRERLGGAGSDVLVLPMDGYHRPLAELDATKNEVYERGAEHTFDKAVFKRDLLGLRGGEESRIEFPGFDHAKGDPEPGVHVYERAKHKVVIVEGLYLLREDWGLLEGVFDKKVFLDADVDRCIEALKVRNRCIPGYTPEEIDARCEAVDRKNAEAVVETKINADVVLAGVN
jgi:pantothenate kinase